MQLVTAVTEGVSNPSFSSKWATRAQIRVRFQICERSLTSLMKKKVLPFVKIGRIVRFDIPACDEAFKAFERRSVVTLQKQSKGRV